MSGKQSEHYPKTTYPHGCIVRMTHQVVSRLQPGDIAPGDVGVVLLNHAPSNDGLLVTFYRTGRRAFVFPSWIERIG